MTIESFISANPARGSKRGRRCLLDPHRADVLKLARLGYTHKQIARYLCDEKDLAVTEPTVSRYLQANNPKTKTGESNV